MAGPGLVGNLDTGLIVRFFEEKNVPVNIDLQKFQALVNKLPLF